MSGPSLRPRVAILLGAAWPDNDASGPVQSVRMICDALADRAHFDVFARSGASGEAPLVPSGTAIQHSSMTVHHFDVGTLGARGLISRLRAVDADAYWLNSVWDREFTLPALAARALGRLPSRPTLLSTRGEFSPGALSLHRTRKALMRLVLRRSGLLRGVQFHATNEIEQNDVLHAFPGHPVLVADNVRPLIPAPVRSARPDTSLRICYIGRISPVKGLDRALQSLALVQSPVHFSIWGPVHDDGYWSLCRRLIQELPANVSVDILGSIANPDVSRAMSAQDLFINLSASENFGHTIIEALMAGTPVITGTATPWNDLERDRAGFNVPVENASGVAAAIDLFANLPQDEAATWRSHARSRVERFHRDQTALRTWQAWLASCLVQGNTKKRLLSVP